MENHETINSFIENIKKFINEHGNDEITNQMKDLIDLLNKINRGTVIDLADLKNLFKPQTMLTKATQNWENVGIWLYNATVAASAPYVIDRTQHGQVEAKAMLNGFVDYLQGEM